MARRTKAKAQAVSQTATNPINPKANQDAPGAPVATVPVKELARRILEVNRTLREKGLQTPVPCFIGPTRSGKTERVHQLAQELGLELVVLLPGTEYPEEILGYLRPVRQDGDLVVKPLLREELAKCVNSGHLFLVDELDKAQKETISALLTLLAHRRVRNIQFHPDTEVICAMQPVQPEVFLSTETGRALAGRLVFLQVKRKEAFEYIRQQTGYDLSFLCVEQDYEPPILQDPAPSLVLWAANFIPQYLKRWGEEGLREILYGALPASAVDGMLEVILQDFVDVFDIAKANGKLKEWAEAAEVGELVVHLPDIITTDWRAAMVGIKRVVLETDVETSTVALHTAFTKLYNLMVENGGVYEFDPSCSEEEGALLFSQTLKEIAEELQRRQEARK